MDDFRGTRALVNKVAPVTVAFWVIKVLSTAMGEATSDFLVHTIGAIPGVAIGFVLFAITLSLQFTARGYGSVRYWSAIVGVSVFGTMVAGRHMNHAADSPCCGASCPQALGFRDSHVSLSWVAQ